jgi:chromate transporter
MSELAALGVLLAQLSLMAFGGGVTIVPELQRHVVQVHGWLDAREFAVLYSLAQAAPGPNLMILPLIGWRIAGFAGALTGVLAGFGPSSLLMLFVSHLWDRYRHARWRTVVQAGLTPVTAGLVASGAALIADAAMSNRFLMMVAMTSAGLAMSRRIPPIAILAAGAAAGALGAR